MNYGQLKSSVTSASVSDEWETPDDLVHAIVECYGPIGLDVAATPENAKAPRYFTKADDALTKDWVEACPAGSIVFCNPPYSKPNKPGFVKKALETARGGRTSVVVIPANTRDGWFQDSLFRKFTVEAHTYSTSGRLAGLLLSGPNWAASEGYVYQDLHFLRGSVKFRSPLNPKNNGTPGGVLVAAFLCPST